jgi:hypothetical protein
MSTKLSGSALQEKRQKADESPSAAHTVQRLKLELILQHVGAGDWYYIALVNKRWCTFYRPICEDDAKLQKTWTIVQGRRRFTRPICVGLVTRAVLSTQGCVHACRHLRQQSDHSSWRSERVTAESSHMRRCCIRRQTTVSSKATARITLLLLCCFTRQLH